MCFPWRFVPLGLVTLSSFLLVVGLVVLAVLIIVSLVAEQLVSLSGALPEIANTVGQYLQNALNPLQNEEFLPGDS